MLGGMDNFILRDGVGVGVVYLRLSSAMERGLDGRGVQVHSPSVEGEFALKLGRDLPPRAVPYVMDEVADAVEAVAGSIEVVGTRFAGGLAGKGRLLITADCSANIAFVAGAWRHDWKSFDLKSHAVVMTINGAERGRGTGERALGHAASLARPPEGAPKRDVRLDLLPDPVDRRLHLLHDRVRDPLV